MWRDSHGNGLRVLVLGAGVACGASAAAEQAVVTRPRSVCEVPVECARAEGERRGLGQEQGRGLLLARLTMSNMCLPPNPTPEQLEEVIRLWDTLPESVTGRRGPFNLRFNVAEDTFVGNGAIGPSGTATAASLTYSFPPDVMLWGSGTPPTIGVNNLQATHVAAFGPTLTDFPKEFIRQGFAAFEKWAGVTYAEVTDDGRPYDMVSGRRAGVGDVRIGGAAVSATAFVAYNAFPANGSDMFLDTAWYGPVALTSISDNFRLLRNLITHEHGHGVGKIHQVPCNSTKLMEPFLSAAFDVLQIDDIRAAQRNFGDRFSGNHSPFSATDLGDITGGPTGRSIRLPLLSTNGAFGPSNPTGNDWFVLSSTVSGRPVTFRVRPRGGSYVTGAQGGPAICDGGTATVDASQAGNLRLEMYFLNPLGAPFAVSSAGGPGANEELNFLLGTGPHWLRVVDEGPNPGVNQVVQLYDLEILVNNQPSEPWAVAGADKIARVGEPCYFIPLNSQATEPGATLGSYLYDLDSDGTFEGFGGSVAPFTFTTPGTRTVTVRVVDSNGKFDDDTIVVNVLSVDTCNGAQQVYLNTPLAGTTVGATADGDALHPCAGSSDAGVWYRFVPPATSTYSISTCPVAIDTVVSIYSGTCESGLTPLDCNDDNFTVCPGSIRASLIPGVVLSAGRSYYIKVSGFLNESGTFTLNVNSSLATGSCCLPTGPCEPTDQAQCTVGGGLWTNGGTCLPNTCVPVNDACASALPLTLNTPVTGTTVRASTSDADGSAFCNYGSNKVVWFTFTPGASTRYKVNTCGTTFGNTLLVFATPCGDNTRIACDDSYTANPPCPDAAGAPARIGSVALISGTTYRISVGGEWFGGTNWDSGSYQIVVRCFADINDSGTVSVQDIFEFLALYFASDLGADTNGSGAISVQDIFDFLESYFAGCA